VTWKETVTLEERTKFIADYLNGSYNMTELCELYGVSRKTGYKWKERFEEAGPEGLLDRSRAPHNHPKAVPESVVATILRARESHPTWGPKKLLWLLSEKNPELALPAESTCGEILKRHGLSSKRRRRRKTDRYTEPFREATEPNRIWCIDFKGEFKTRDKKYCYPLTITDAYSRYLLRCQALPRTGADLVRPVMESVFIEYGLPDIIRSDNGSPFASRAPQGLSDLSVWWLKLGITHERIVPGHPEQNGRHERMHKTLKAETTKPAAKNLREQQQVFDAFCEEYNQERPHEALDLTPPSTQYYSSERRYTKRLKKFTYPGEAITREVHQNGRFRWQGSLITIGAPLGGETIGLVEISKGVWEVLFGPLKLGVLDQYHPSLGLIRTI